DELLAIFHRERPNLIEGAGGVLVPLNDTTLMIDFMSRLALPTVVVTRPTLGTINHTLLTLEALRRRDVMIAGVVMAGKRNDENAIAIERFGGVHVVEIDELVELL